MKKVKIFLAIAFALSVVSGCLKDKANVDLSTIAPIAEISSSNVNSALNAPSSGLDYFNAATLPYIGADTMFDVNFNVNIASEFPLNKDVTVTVAIDDAKRIAYNANLSAANQFVAPADSNFSFPVKTAVIKAGTRLAQFKVTFFPQTLDPAKSYMLPVTLTDASGVAISGNLSTIYLHIIGNPLAGVYNWDWTRFNASDTTDPANIVSSFVANAVTMVPDDATTVEVKDNYYNSPRFVLTFTNTNGVLSNFKLTQNAADVKYMNDNGITITDGPNIIKADPVNKVFEFSYGVFNGSANRYLVDKYYK